MKNNKNYTVITGASSGIGRAAAKAFAGRGKNLILTARRKERLEELKKELNEHFPLIDIMIKVCDLSEPSNVFTLYGELESYSIETWINNAGLGDYSSVANQDLDKIRGMLHLNIEALTILSTLFVRDYKDTPGTQLINLSSRGGYVLVPNAVIYCASKFYVSAFTEGLAWELKTQNAKLRAKVLAPAATKTEFGMAANNVSSYDYDKSFGKYHSSEQMAGFLLQLYDSDQTVGIVNYETFEFTLRSSIFDYVGNSSNNQKR